MSDKTRQGVRNLDSLPGRGGVPARRRHLTLVWHSCIAESETRYEVQEDECFGGGVSVPVAVCRVCGRRIG